MLLAILRAILVKYVSSETVDAILEDLRGTAAAQEQADTPMAPSAPRVSRWEDEPDPYLAECLYDEECRPHRRRRGHHADHYR